MHNQYETAKYSGGVEYLIYGAQSYKKDIVGIRVQYGPAWQALFFGNTENELYEYVHNSRPIEIADKETIKIDYSHSGSPIWGNKLENIFLPWPRENFLEFKKDIQPILDKYRGSVVVRKNIYPYVVFHGTHGGIDALVNNEDLFRLFWQLIADGFLQIISSECIYQDKSGKEHKIPLLSRSFIERESEEPLRHLTSYKINKYSFGDGSGNWKQLEPNIQQWFRMGRDKEWEPVFSAIKFKSGHGKELATRSDYTALVAAIETFMSLIGIKGSGTTAILEKFCDNYSWAEWDKEFKINFASAVPNIGNVAKCFAEVRNVIAHPKAIKDKPIYATIAYDDIKLHKIYVFLSALFVKAVLSRGDNIDRKNLKKFAMELLESRVNIYPIEWEE